MNTIAMKTELLLRMIMISTLIQCYDSYCDSPQYLELGKPGTIDCLLPEEYFTVLWYTADDFEKGTPSLQSQNLAKTGAGYESGEFDMYPNGSLIITNVTWRHETTFTVAYIRSKDEIFQETLIRIILIVKPEIPYPVIGLCNDSKACYDKTDGAIVQCSVKDVRPNVSLSLMARTLSGDKNISNNVTILRGEVGYTSIVTTRNVFRNSSLLALLVCTASSPPRILKISNSMILLENTDVDVDQLKAESVYIKRGTELKLNCTEKDIGFFVWKKANPLNYTHHKTVLYSVLMGEGFAEIMDDDVILEDRSFLKIYSTNIKHEGIYFCIFGDGLSDGMTAHNVNVIVPAYPEVLGCNQLQYCILEAENEGNLTCTVKGIRPQVQLRWKTFLEEDTNLISFTNPRITVKKHYDAFDVTLTSQYRVRDESREKFTLVCEVVASQNDLFRLTIKMDLLIPKGTELTTEPSYTNLTWLIPNIVALIVVFALSGVIFVRYLRKQNTVTADSWHDDEMTVMFDKSKAQLELRQQFLNQVRGKYQDLYDAVQPISYIKDRLYCVDQVFVEGGIEYMNSTGGAMKGQWTKLASYQNVFDDSRVKSTRRILEGEPGYGKSTITLQFSYDWCNSVSTSALRDVDIFILLRLRQLGGVSSIYRAIKQFILPKDSRLSESDIETILQDSNSVVIILDGFDEYPDQDSSASDVISIIARQMFQNFEVVLTTRSSFLPQKYPPSTKRLRLTGFDDNARRYYIQKAVVGNDDDESVKRIEGYLEENPILNDLCQVPLLFVIFAHMTYESEDFRKLNSVTSFFRYMMTCFHSHMRNKMNEENVSKYELFETDHAVLDKVAFEAFSGNSQRIVWKKDELCEQLGHEFYDQYIRIGILVEEEVIDITDNPSAPITDHVQYKTEVRFYHKLFSEWYAAHYLSDYIQHHHNLDLSAFLQNIDPFNVQYLYRFACGLNSNTAEKIIDYLKGIEGGDKFTILCILEQTGKIDNIMETIRQLCYEGIIFSGYDSLLLQRSSLQLLEIAARNDIPIKYVELYNCLQSVDLSTAAIRTTSGLALTSRIPVKLLSVSLHNREMTEDECIAILQFSSMCPALRRLWFGGSAPPRSFTVEPVLSTLGSRNVHVQYCGVFGDSPKYILNLQTGRWESKEDGTECTDEGFERMNLDWTEVQDDTDEDYKLDVRESRGHLRRLAEEEQNESSDDDDYRNDSEEENSHGEHRDDEDDNN